MGTPAAVKVGPGLLYIAPIGTTEPTSLTGALPSAWVAVGYTDDGSEFTFQTNFADVEVAEELDPIKTVATGRMTSVKFAMAEVTASNLKKAFNGGTISGPTGGYVTFEPPDLGDETPVMIVWQADDDQERWLFRKVLQVGSVTMARKKAPNKATIAVEFKCQVPDNGDAVYKAWVSSALSYA